MIILGESAAERCYRSAELARANLASVRDCDIALADDASDRETRARLHVNRAVIYLSMNRSSNAIRDLKRAQALGHDAPEVHQNYSAAYIQLKQPSDAIEAATRALELGTDHPHRAHFNRGVAYEMLGDFDAAYVEYTTAAELSPDWPLPHQQLQRFTVVE
ncbi:MAG: tetratricopeptide repeat protein [Wenzhouxiangella sp.]